MEKKSQGKLPLVRGMYLENTKESRLEDTKSTLQCYDLTAPWENQLLIKKEFPSAGRKTGKCYTSIYQTRPTHMKITDGSFNQI